MKKITLLLMLFVFYLPSQAQTYLQENFDTEIPTTWTITDGGAATGDSWISGQQGGANSLNGTNGALVDSDANGNGTLLQETLTSPAFDASAATTLFLDFDQFYNNIGADTAIIEVFDGTSWVEVLNQSANAGAFNNPDQQHIDITAYQNASMQIRFVYDDGDVWAWYWMIDNVHVYNSTCNFPTNLAVSVITDNSAILDWTAGGTENAWEVIIQAAGGPVPTGVDSGVVATNPYPATALTPSTAYEAYVRGDCLANGFSIWAGPVSFSTLNVPPPPPVGVTCASGSSSFIFTEDFETDPAAGWTGTGFSGGNGNWDITAGNANSFGTGPAASFSGGMHLEYEASGNAADIASAISPAIDLTAAVDGAELSFYMHAFGADMGTLNVGVGTSAAGPFATLYSWIGDYQTTDAEAWVPIGINLDAYLGQVVYIEFSYGGAGTGFEGDMSIDFFRVESCGTFCIAPSGINITNITDISADIDWTANSGEAAWEIVVVPAGTGEPAGAGTPTPSNNPYNATGLTASSAYEVWVRADCGAGVFSVWSGPVNFTTLNTPPPPPVGVTCTTGSSSFIFTEDFETDPPAGWTGTGFSGDNGNWDITAGNANSFGTGPNASFSGGMHLEYEASGNAADIASAISPAIDLSTAVDGAELSFYMHSFGADMGTLNVGISTSVAGPFTNLYTWIGDYQTTDAEAWVPIGINLDAYLGQVVYVEFSYGGAGTGFEGDMSIDFFRVEACGDFCIAPSGLTVSNITGTTADIDWTPNSGELAWEYVVVPAGTGAPTGAGTASGSTSVNETGLSFSTDYEVWVRADCGAGAFSVWAGPVNFTTTIQTVFNVDCTAGPINSFYCYENNDTNVFTYTSSDGSPLNLTINSGQVEGAPWDFLVVLDSDGVTELYNGEGNNGDLSGLTFQSTGDTIYFSITSDGVIGCSSGSFCCSAGIDYTVACATCINPAATYVVVDDCANGPQFLIDVNVTSMGDATSLTISNSFDGTTIPVNAVGTYQAGPFPFVTPIVITINNDQDVNCVINSQPIELQACPPANDNPCNAIVALVNDDDSCTLVTPGTLLEATDSGIVAGTCTGDPDDDVWYEFTATSDFQIISILNIVGTGFPNIDHGVYEGTCGALTELYCSDAIASITPLLTIGNTYYVRVFSAGSNNEDFTFDLCIKPGSGNVSVDQTTYTIEELVIDVLIDSPCAQISNITYSTGTDFGDVNGIGYFSALNGGFPFDEGILLTSGDASLAGGPNVNAMSDGGFAWVGDADLDAAVGINSNNASIIEFDFVPLSNEISFDFLMASEEYNGSTGGSFECTFSDAFAFLLTDQFGVTTNLAVLPGTTTPILVTNIHPANNSCAAINEEYFGGYIPANLPPISFDGRTVVFTAFAPVNIGQSYHIKLVMADASDAALDSGVFLKAGSFDIGEIELGEDITIAGGDAICNGEPVTLSTQAPSVAHVWYKDGFVIPGETSNILVVTEPGEYVAQIIFSPSCNVSDTVIVEFLPNPVANTPPDLNSCSTSDTAIFNLTDNDAAVLGTQDPADFTVTYHVSEQDAIDGVAALASPYTNTSNPEVIYVRVEDNLTACKSTTSFNLVITTPSHTAESVDIIECDNDFDGEADFDLAAHDANVLGGQDASLFIVSYYASEADAQAGTGALTSPYASSGETVYVRVETAFADCYVVNSFDLILGTTPITTFTTDFDYEVCPNATVPIIITATPGNYSTSEVTINWYLDNGLIAGENGLTLAVLLAGDYEIEVIFNDTGCIGIQEQVVIELESCIIPQGISPNGDGMNDTFDLSSYDVSKLEVFNRNGTLVYEKKNYTNEWHGQDKDGDELPVGTYFYTMEYENGKQRSAWVYIQRLN